MCVKRLYLAIIENRRRGAFRIKILCEGVACGFAFLYPFLKTFVAAVANRFGISIPYMSVVNHKSGFWMF